jgi:hypothetical protein
MADLNIGGVNLYEEKALFSLASAEDNLQAPVTTTPATTPPATETTTAPPPVVTQAPTITAAVPSVPPAPERLGGTAEDTGELSEVEQLRQLLTSRYQENLRILQEQLEKAPEALKPAIQEAIEVLRRGYELAIASLG